MPQTIYEFGGVSAKSARANAPVMHLAVANGFPPQTYAPLLKPFMADYRIVSLPPRALWVGEHQPPETRSWRNLADDLLAGMEQYSLRQVVGVGHSFGAVASALAAIRQPERFRALVLLDPTILPPFWIFAVQLSRLAGIDHPLTKGALRRRRHFESVDEAFTYFRGKRLFGNWSDDVLRLYAESMLRPSANGSGMELAWTPEWEAHYYRRQYLWVWRDMRRLRGLVPLLIVRGGTSDTFVPEAAARLRRVLPTAAYAEVAGHGHLFPQSAPEESGKIIEGWLARLARQ
jgi:pimeloyl-ACP methyl ester carboxylesterase